VSIQPGSTPTGPAPPGSTPSSRQRPQWPASQQPASADGSAGETEPSAAVFLVLRRMRVPLVTLVLVFAISVFGLSLVPGEAEDGSPVRMTLFDAFYFMSYTATTIGFGELPHAFTHAQRLWVVVCIYLTVVAWAYAIGALLTLLQDRAFRQALAVQHFERKVRRISEPFLIVAGYGQTGALVVRSFDRLGRQLVVLDTSADKIDALDLMPYRGDVPGLVADVRSPTSCGAPGWSPPGARACWRSPTTTRRTSRSPWPSRCCAPTCPWSRDGVADHRPPHARLRLADRHQPLRPLRRAPAASLRRPAELPPHDVAGGRSGADCPARGTRVHRARGSSAATAASARP
jgi:hypothetical protein